MTRLCWRGDTVTASSQRKLSAVWRASDTGSSRSNAPSIDRFVNPPPTPPAPEPEIETVYIAEGEQGTARLGYNDLILRPPTYTGR